MSALLENFTPSRSTMVHTVESSLASQLSASQGSISMLSLNLNRPSLMP